MKLSEALIERADRQKRIEQLRQRLMRSAKVQDGEQPPENPQTLLAEVTDAIAELSNLIQRINRTNARTNFDEENTISDVLARRDMLLLERSVIDSLVSTAAVMPTRYGLSEIKIVSTVDIAELQRQSDRLAQQYRELDTQIQATNWETELLD